MFPPLCFVDAVNPDMSNESLEILKDSLTKEQYELITNSDNAKVEIKFKAYEMWQNSKQKVKLLLDK